MLWHKRKKIKKKSWVDQASLIINENHCVSNTWLWILVHINKLKIKLSHRPFAPLLGKTNICKVSQTYWVDSKQNICKETISWHYFFDLASHFFYCTSFLTLSKPRELLSEVKAWNTRGKWFYIAQTVSVEMHPLIPY